MGKREELELLKHGQWLNDRVPDILTVGEAFNRQGEGRFYAVHWWGDLPAGFTRFDFKPTQVSGALVYAITLRNEPHDKDDLLEADEYVLMFSG